MTTTFERDLSRAPGTGDSAGREYDEERSIREALRITLLFVAVVILLLWAGVADAASGSAASPERSASTSRP
jgi:hypothetical protein